MTTFYLVRHGNVPCIIGDPELSELGKGQAQVTRDVLKKIKFTAVYSSPLKRAAQTAKIISEPHNIKINIDNRLRERVNWGDLPGQTFDEFVAMWEKSNNDREIVPVVGDSSKMAGERLEKFLREIYLNIPNGNILVVTHGGIIIDFLKNIFSDGTYSYNLKECSITTANFNGNEFKETVSSTNIFL